MWKKLNRWARDNPLGWGVLLLLLALPLNNVTVDVGQFMSEWQFDIIWFLVAMGWTAFSVALAMLSKYLWDKTQERLERRLRMERRSRGSQQKRQEAEATKRLEEREDNEQKHQLAVRIWDECEDDAIELNRVRHTTDGEYIDMLTIRLAGTLRGLDPYLDAYDPLDKWQESTWVERVSEIIIGTDPSAKTLDRIRKKARDHLQRHDEREARDPF